MNKHTAPNILLPIISIIPVIALTGALVLHEQRVYARPHQVYARSFMATRPIYQHMSTQQSLWHSIIYNKRAPDKGTKLDNHTENRKGSAFRVLNIIGQSIPMHKTAHYFLPPCIDRVLVAGDNTPPDVQCKRAIRAEWLGLDHDFQGSFTITPKEQQYAFSLEYNQDFGTWLDFPLLKDYWISITVPVVAVYHSLNFKEHVLSNTHRSGDLYQAFNNRDWQFAKLTECSHVIRPTEIRVRIGNALVSHDYFQFAYNTIFIAPMGNKQNARELFPAIAGNNQHFAFGAAIFFQFPLNSDTSEYGICFFANLESIFNIRNTQLRTFDLKDKPWSRYLLFNQRCGTANELPGPQKIPGVNILTREVLIRPYGVFDFSMGLRYISPLLEAEFGYSIWGKSNEKAELKRPWYHPCQYEGIFGIAGEKENTTASNSTIAQRAPDDNNAFVPIDMIFDINTQSGESGSALNHKVHGSIGLQRDHKNATIFFVSGAYIDIPQKNGALRTWGIWISYGASF